MMRARITQRILLLCLLATIPFFFIGGPDLQTTPLVKQIWNAGHIGFFALAVWLGLQFFPLARFSQGITILLSVFVIGLSIECLQLFVAREFSLLDAYFNVVGAAIGLAWSSSATLLKISTTTFTKLTKPRLWLVRIFTLSLTAPYLITLTQAMQLHWHSHHQFPFITGFEQDSEVLRLSGNFSFSDNIFSQGQRSLKIDFDTRTYSTVSIDYLLGDWRGFETLSMDLFNPDPLPLAVILRIADQQHDRGQQAFNDRFNRRLTLVTGWNHIEIALDDIRKAPAPRELQLDQITNIALFSHQLPEARVAYWDNIQLTESPSQATSQPNQKN